MTTPTKAARLAGRYRVLRRLGSGGMASVLLCRDERLGREVAVKRLHAASPEDVARRFAREARVGPWSSRCPRATRGTPAGPATSAR